MKYTITLLALLLTAVNGHAAQLDLSKDASGWTVFVPSSDSRIMYVSASGNDTAANLNDAGVYTQSTHPAWSTPFDPGTIQPFATISAAMAHARPGYADWVLLKRGDTFAVTGTDPAIDPNNGKSISEPSLVGAYGTSGDSPIVAVGETVPIALQVMRGQAVKYEAISGIDFYSYTRDPGNAGYIGPTGTTQLGIKIYRGDETGVADDGVLIEGCKFRFFNSNVIQTDNIYIDGLTIRRNMIVDTYSGEGQGHSQGLYLQGQNPLFEENILIHNGWLVPYGGGEGAASIYNHNMYLSSMEGGTFSKNIIVQGSNSNIKVAAGFTSNANLMDFNNNLFIDGQFGIGFANNYTDAVPPYYEDNTSPFQNIRITSNVISDMGRSKNLQGIARGIAIPYDTTGGVITGNIIMNQEDATITDSIAYRIGGILQNITFSGNVTHNVKNTIGIQIDDVGDGNSTGSTKMNVDFSENKFQSATDGGYVGLLESTSTGVTFSGNVYYTDRPDGERYSVASFDKTDAQWAAATGDTSIFEQHAFPDPTRSIETYMASLGETATLDAFIAKARAQDRYSWDARFTADAVNDYIRAGFGMGQRRLFRNVRVSEVEP